MTRTPSPSLRKSLALCLLVSLSWAPISAAQDDLDEDDDMMEDDDDGMSAELSGEASLGMDGIMADVDADAEQAAPCDEDEEFCGPYTGYEIGARGAYGLPFGEIAEGKRLDDNVSAHALLQIDGGYRLFPWLFVGAYVALTPSRLGGSLRTTCENDANFNCGAWGLSAGVQGQYRFFPGELADPWVGAGLGIAYQRVTLDWRSSGEHYTSSTALPEVTLQAGVDFGPRWAGVFGPFMSFSFGQFGSQSGDCQGSICNDQLVFDATIDEPATHYWLNLGLRGTLLL